MKNTMPLSVSEKVFEERFKDKVEVDSIKYSYTAGKLRGRIDPAKKTFHVFIAGGGPENFSTVFSGKYDRKELTYSVTVPKATKIMLVVASVFWVILSYVLMQLYNPFTGALVLLAIPIMLFPLLKKDKNAKTKLEKRLRKLCLTEDENTEEEKK